MSELNEVENAIRTLQSSFTYDPPEQWRPAFRLLEEKRRQIHKALRPAALARILALAMPLVAWTLVIPNKESLGNVTVYLFALMICLPVLTSVAIELIMAHRRPLVRQLDAIEAALRPFRDIPEVSPS